MRTRRRDRANASNSALAFCDRRTQMQGEHFSHFLALKPCSKTHNRQHLAFGLMRASWKTVERSSTQPKI
jgi:hypothetical protein